LVIVGGWFEVDPSERDAFVAQRVDGMRRSRAEPGCIEYVIAADPVDPGRAILFERWESQAHLDAHLAAARQAPPSAAASDAPAVAPSAVSIVVYDVAGERPLG
jgi:quinol monooxygenase YgiN